MTFRGLWEDEEKDSLVPLWAELQTLCLVTTTTWIIPSLAQWRQHHAVSHANPNPTQGRMIYRICSRVSHLSAQQIWSTENNPLSWPSISHLLLHPMGTASRAHVSHWPRWWCYCRLQPEVNDPAERRKGIQLLHSSHLTAKDALWAAAEC